MNFRSAKLQGVQAAAELHEKLGIRDRVRSGLEQVDVFSAIKDLDVPLLCRPLEGLLGAYVTKPESGILVTTTRRLPIQRFTAAHELGHFWMKHDEAFDSEETISMARQGVAGVPLQEVAAESFASEFLLPKILIFKTLSRHRWSKGDLRNPTIVYQLSLRLGVSYEAMWRALIECAFIDVIIANHLKATAPKECKADVLGADKLDDPWADAFLVTHTDNGSHINAGQGDAVVIELQEHSAGGYRWLNLAGNDVTQVVSDGATTPSQLYGSVSTRRIIIKGASTTTLHLEERRPWESNGEPLKTFDLSIDFNGKEFGLPRCVKNVL